MTRATCEECGHGWATRVDSPDEYDDGPRCSECGSTAVEVGDGKGPDDPHAGPGFDPDVATGSDRDDDAEELREALLATPGVGKQGAEYAVYWYRKSVESPEDLHEVLTDVDGVDQQVARRVVETVYSVSDAEDAEVPAYSGESGRESAEVSGDTGGSADTLEALIRAREAGLIGDDDDSGTDAEDIAAAVSEAVSPALRQMSETQQLLAQALSENGEDETSEIEELKAEIRELKEDKERERIEELREEIRDLKDGAGEDDIDALRIRKAHEMLDKAPTASAEAAEAWEDVLHGLLGRAKSLERQQAMLEGPDGGPSYTPSGSADSAPSPGQTAANGQQATQDHREDRAENRENSTRSKKDDYQDNDTHDPQDTDMTEPNTNTDSTDAEMSEAEPSGVTEERARSVREKLNLTDSDGEEVSV